MNFRILLLLILLFALPTQAQDSARADLTAVLDGYVVNGKVDYNGIRKDRWEELQAFVDGLANAEPEKLNKTDQIAFWLDAYNGLVVYQVIEKDAAPDSGRARSKFFRGRQYQVAGQERTLDDIEHKALLPLAEDPRLHFVLVCGAQSCPPLRASSFLGAGDLNEELEKAAKAYINDPDNVTIDATNQKIVLNKIFDWYKDDFGNVLEFVARYHSDGEQLLSGDWDIDYRDYDWNLNQAED
ncbi:MAG: DUF547 domain-containing protein [Candidatus Eremiobacteraeota bacterium]|nr:DUF547 domain-containing protein [Candidatus Eremiobacteraeota bacterium]